MNVQFQKYKEAQRNYMRRKRAELIERLGGKCVICNSTENLETDHINSALKRMPVTAVLSTSELLKAEIDNLQLLCKPHHKIKTRVEHLKAIASRTIKRKQQHGKNRITYRTCGPPKCEPCKAYGRMEHAKYGW